MSAAVARAIAWRHATHAAVCDRIEPWEHGTTVFASDVPSFWNFNSVRVEDPHAGLGAEQIVAAADRLQAALAHRHVEIEDEAAGARVRPGMEAAGWGVERLVWMELEGPPAGTPAAVEITEMPFARTRPLREAWFLTNDWNPPPEEARAFLPVEEIVAARRGTRALMAWSANGEPLGFVSFSTAGDLAEVEQVYVRPDRRGGGTGGALVSAAVRAAGARSTFKLADDEGDPKRLYARLGFRPIWVQHQFTRRPGESGGPAPAATGASPA
jgi:GNAT superfamily N-acetyltransferase